MSVGKQGWGHLGTCWRRVCFGEPGLGSPLDVLTQSLFFTRIPRLMSVGKQGWGYLWTCWRRVCLLHAPHDWCLWRSRVGVTSRRVTQSLFVTCTPRLMSVRAGVTSRRVDAESITCTASWTMMNRRQKLCDELCLLCTALCDELWLLCTALCDELWFMCTVLCDELWLLCTTLCDELWFLCTALCDELWLLCTAL